MSDSLTTRELLQAAKKARFAKLEYQHSLCLRADAERESESAQFVADWQARFNSARNARCTAA